MKNNGSPRLQPHKFQPTEDVFTQRHEDYRTLRAHYAIEHHEMFVQAAAVAVQYVSLAESEADCDAMLAGINTGQFLAPFYMTRFVHKKLTEIRTGNTAQSGMIVDNFARSDKERRGQSTVSAEIAAAGIRERDQARPKSAAA